MANFIRIEASPPLPIDTTGETQNVIRVREIDESIPDITAITEIHPQVQEIKTATMTFID